MIQQLAIEYSDLVQVARRRMSTTNSRHGYRLYPNLLKDCMGYAV